MIENEISRVLADEVLFGRLAKGGGRVEVDLVDGKLAFAYPQSPAATAPPAEEPGDVTPARRGRMRELPLRYGDSDAEDVQPRRRDGESRSRRKKR